jgi:hypothetical protein
MSFNEHLVDGDVAGAAFIFLCGVARRTSAKARPSADCGKVRGRESMPQQFVSLIDDAKAID